MGEPTINKSATLNHCMFKSTCSHGFNKRTSISAIEISSFSRDVCVEDVLLSARDVLSWVLRRCLPVCESKYNRIARPFPQMFARIDRLHEVCSIRSTYGALKRTERRYQILGHPTGKHHRSAGGRRRNTVGQGLTEHSDSLVSKSFGGPEQGWCRYSVVFAQFREPPQTCHDAIVETLGVRTRERRHSTYSSSRCSTSFGR